MEGLSTAKLAKEGGVNVETIRYYERHGLLPKAPRTTSGYRKFSGDYVIRLRFIRHAQELGFTLKEVKELLDRLPSLFNWIILDSPPLLFAADANLLSTLCHGTILVVRIGATTIDSITRAMQSLCQNNVLGIVVNGARRGELYSKYTYYHSYYPPNGENGDLEEPHQP